MTYRPVVVFILLLSLVLSACAVGQAPAPVTPPNQPAVGATPANGSPQPTVITFGALESERQRFAPLITQFNTANPDIEVRFVPVDSWINLRQQNEELLNRGVRALASMADTVFLTDPQPGVLTNPALADLTPLIDADATFNRKDFFPAALPTTADAQRVLPLSINLPLLAYNQDLWAQRGLPPPDAAWTWPDLLQAVDQLAQKQGDTIVVSGLFNGGMANHAVTALLGDLAAANMPLLGPEPQRAALTHSDVALALDRTVQRIGTGALPALLGDRFEDTTPRILNGQVALWPADLLAGAPAPSFGVGYVPFPAGPAPVTSVAEGVALSSGSQHPEAAWRWITFVSQQSAPLLTASPTQLPARESVRNSSLGWQQLPAAVQAVQNLVAQRPVAAAAVTTADQPVIDAVTEALEAVLDGQTTTMQALQTAQAQVQQAANAPAASAAAPIVVATPPPPTDPNVARITLAVAVSDDETLFPEAVKRFYATHPMIEVTTEAQTNGASLQELVQNADCVVGFAPGFRDQALPVVDLSPFIESDKTDLRTDFLPQTLAAFERDGKQIGLPLVANFPLLIYNKKVFDARGVDYPQASWTLDDLLRTAERLTQRDGPQPTYGFVYANGEALLLPYMLSQRGASLVQGQGDERQPQLTAPQTVAALQAFLDLLRVGAPLPTKLSPSWSPTDWDAQRQIISRGQAGMWLASGTWDLRGLTFPPDGSLVITTPPYATHPPMVGPRDVMAGYISAQTLHPEACWTLLHALSADVALVQRLGMPVRSSVGDSADYQAAARPNAVTVFQSYRTALSRPAEQRSSTASQSPFYYYWLLQALQAALQGKPLTEELERAQVRTADFMRCMHMGTDAPTCAKQAAPADPGWLAN
ncbi:MAG: extracellular solute-binding protein [Chloroflexaceae bacterium]|nr:extracellular solute-binding protein [Chloroflexaceae bacterium]